MDDEVCLVLDNGSGMIKVGFAGDDAPRSVFPCVFGRVTDLVPILPTMCSDSFVGDEAQAKRGILEMSYPMENGVVMDWDLMEKIWHHSFFNELRVSPEDHMLLISEAMQSSSNRSKMAEIMFENHQIPGLSIQIPALLSMYGSGLLDGIVLDCGDTVAQVVGIKEGYCMEDSIYNVGISGRNLTEYLMDLLEEKGYDFTTTAEREVVREMKEKVCFVVEDFDKRRKTVRTSQTRVEKETYTLPDGEVIKVGEELFQCPEALFHPGLTGCGSRGVHECVLDCAAKCTVYGEATTLLLSGGSTMFKGFEDRIRNEIERNSGKMRVIAPPERKYSGWIGGSILASLSSFHNKVVSREAYNESGYRAFEACL